MVGKTWTKVGVVWGAASTGVAACLYLFDLATTASALVTYYFYQFKCPQADPASPLLRRDAICRIIRSNPDLHSISTAFWACLSFLLVAYPMYGLIFWISLPRRQHPLRLAYFLPLFHLYRLFQLLRHSFSFKELEELQKTQREVSSLYNAVGAALETASQFFIQCYIATRLGEFIRGSADASMQAQRIPTNLVLSLVASLVSACYSTSLAVSLLMPLDVPFAKRTCVAILVGCQTLASMLAKALTTMAIGQFSKEVSFPLLSYLFVGLIISWIFVGFTFQIYYPIYQTRNMCMKFAHSFILALIIRPITPIYVIVKQGKRSCLLIWGTLAHILVELIGIALVLLRPGYLKERESPCHCLHITRTTEECNKYPTCKVYLGILLPSLFAIILTTLLFISLMKSDNNARDILETTRSTHTKCIKTSSSIKTYPLSNAKGSSSYQMSTTLFGLILVTITIVFIRKLQIHGVIKDRAKKY